MRAQVAGRSLAVVAAFAVLPMTAPAAAQVDPPQAAPSALVTAAAPTTPRDLARAAYRQLSRNERVGQLFAVALPSTGTTRTQRHQLRRFDVGNAMLYQHTYAGRDAVARVAAKLRRATSYAGVRPLLGTDQEGGQVQDLNGTGFSDMPSALVQGTFSRATLRKKAMRWGRQLRKAGIGVDYAPVADVVPKSVGTSNQPIGRYDREYGHTPRRVAKHVVAFIRGMAGASTLTTVKHFPGLGRATGNTDTSAGVTDPTTRHDPYLRPFRAGIDNGVGLVMVSTATYPNIDDRKAVFSHRIVTGMLRHDMSFHGTVISDSLTTVSVASTPPGGRACRFIAAGGDIVLITSLTPLERMVHAVRDRMRASAAFRRTAQQAVMQVLTTKARAGLL